MALATRALCGKDMNGSTLFSEQRQVLDEAGVESRRVRRLWLRLWGAADGAQAAAERERREDQ